MKIAICDDEKIYLDSICKIVNEYMMNKEIVCQVELFESGEALLKKGKELLSYDIVFLDVNMKEIDGIKTAEKIRTYSERLYIIFVTSFVEFSIQGYRVNAIRYILKEKHARLKLSIEESLNAVLQKMKLNRNVKKRTYKFREGEKEITLGRIMYIESSSHDLRFILMEDNVHAYTLYGKLSLIEKELEGDEFCRIHQSVLINMEYIKTFIKDEITMWDGQMIHIPRARLKLVKEAYGVFKGKEW